MKKDFKIIIFGYNGSEDLIRPEKKYLSFIKNMHRDIEI